MKEFCLISCRGTGLTGSALLGVLRKEYKIQMEMASGYYTIAMTSICYHCESDGELRSNYYNSKYGTCCGKHIEFLFDIFYDSLILGLYQIVKRGIVFFFCVNLDQLDKRFKSGNNKKTEF